MDGTALGTATTGGTNAAPNNGGGSAPANGTGGTPGAGAVGTGGGASASWRDSLPEDIRNHPTISSFQDVPSLTKSFIHAQSQIGKKGVIVPGEKATDEEWNGFFKSMGVPEKDKYDVKLPEGTKADDKAVAFFKEKFAENGILPRQAERLMADYLRFEGETIGARTAQQKAESTKQMEALKTEWGGAFDKELNSAKLAVKQAGGDALIQHLNKTGLGNDTVLIKAFANMAKWMGEDKLREGGVSDNSQSSKEIQSQIDSIRFSGQLDASNPNRLAALAKLESLAKQLTGGR